MPPPGDDDGQGQWEDDPHGSFWKLGVPYFGVLIIRILLFRMLYWVPYFRKLPTGPDVPPCRRTFGTPYNNEVDEEPR